MKLFHGWMVSAVVAGLMFAVVGCGGDKKSEYKEFSSHDVKTAPADDHGHGQGGPHGGAIVELGDEGFHAEVVLDESKELIAVHVLGGDAKTAKPIEATEIVMSFKHGTEIKEFKLAATKQDGDEEGKASLFKVESEDAMEELHEHGEGTLTITLGEKKLTGVVKHSH